MSLRISRHPRRLPRLITLHAVAGLLSRGFFVILDNLVPYELIPTSAPAAPRRYASSFRQKMADAWKLDEHV